MGAWVASLGVLSGCAEPTCVAPDQPLEFLDPAIDDVVRESLSETWQAWHLAADADDLCIRRLDAGRPIRQIVQDAYVDAFYNPNNRTIRIGPLDSASRASRVMRHELCHAWSHQIGGRTSSPDEFHFDSALHPWSYYRDVLADRGDDQNAEEAFAFTCDIRPTTSRLFAGTDCQAEPQAATTLARLHGDVYAGLSDSSALPFEEVVTVILPHLTPASQLVSVREVAEGHLSVWTTDGDVHMFDYLDIATGEVRQTSGHLADLPSLDPGPTSRPDPPPGVATFDAATRGDMSVVHVQLSTPMGPVDRLLVKWTDGEWKAPTGPCPIVTDPVRAIVLDGGAGTELWVAHLKGATLRVVRPTRDAR